MLYCMPRRRARAVVLPKAELAQVLDALALRASDPARDRRFPWASAGSLNTSAKVQAARLRDEGAATGKPKTHQRGSGAGVPPAERRFRPLASGRLAARGYGRARDPGGSRAGQRSADGRARARGNSHRSERLYKEIEPRAD